MFNKLTLHNQLNSADLFIYITNRIFRSFSETYRCHRNYLCRVISAYNL